MVDEVLGVDISILKLATVGHEKDYDKKWILLEFSPMIPNFMDSLMDRDEVVIIGEVSYVDRQKISFRVIRWTNTHHENEYGTVYWKDVGEGTFKWLAPEQVEREVLLRAL